MRKIRMLVILVALVVAVVPTTTLLAIYIDQCPYQCTPNCPCSLQCDGPFGPTTCGAAGQPCTVYRSDNFDLFSILEPEQNMTPMQSNLAESQAQPQLETASEATTAP